MATDPTQDEPDAPTEDQAAAEQPDRPISAREVVAQRSDGQLPMPPRRTGVFVDPDELREFVGGLLRSMLGGYQVDAFGNMTFEAQDARLFVTVGMGPLGPQVGVLSITNVGIELSAELAAMLLTTNHRIPFGAFSYDPEQQAVWLRHSLLGGTLDGPELRGAVLSVANTASKLAPVLQRQFGGGTFDEAPQEVRDNVHPPEPEVDDDTPSNASGYL